ncbi:hypothetical protein CEUSTIGMA_g12202.t1 [Chlamydomonas eustigma]|uniref:TFA2 Winged helix domain-containing protein n=1 Tax=Chlamydomonas eustigma TaxID=1157962 RepID=A0A250XNX7_9CHLO|nr:hypothetical protein CEUSTIGMA_g12202.t1 [Chlamydomonas eustigma]|eukprot:GAX84781.1 hypothetical protein CEUSTIGMA_g12202.t1 [Chlamydomonas eustigma]
MEATGVRLTDALVDRLTRSEHVDIVDDIGFVLDARCDDMCFIYSPPLELGSADDLMKHLRSQEPPELWVHMRDLKNSYPGFDKDLMRLVNEGNVRLGSDPSDGTEIVCAVDHDIARDAECDAQRQLQRRKDRMRGLRPVHGDDRGSAPPLCSFTSSRTNQHRPDLFSSPSKRGRRK